MTTTTALWRDWRVTQAGTMVATGMKRTATVVVAAAGQAASGVRRYRQ